MNRKGLLLLINWTD